ncbi:MAG: sulfurtransferase [Planctomycetaceae bacterium]|nr:sulfurtransferase [Planctomycetaceae bacterium]
MTTPPPLELTPQQVRRMLRDDPDSFTLLDCREPTEWAACRIQPALHIPMGDIPARLQELDPDRPIVVYCHHGMRSLSVTQFLIQHDFTDVKSMAGGIDAWSLQIDPTVPRYD